MAPLATSRRRFLWSGTTALVALALPRTGFPQGSPHPVLARFAGAYVNTLDDGGRARIAEAIERVVSTMTGMRQSVARRRLLGSDPPIPRLRIETAGAGLVVDYTRGRRNQTPALGVYAENPTAEGGTVDVLHDVVGDRLRETYRERRGGAVHLFTLADGGRSLSMVATIRSPHLPSAIVYELPFRRTL